MSWQDDPVAPAAAPARPVVYTGTNTPATPGQTATMNELTAAGGAIDPTQPVGSPHNPMGVTAAGANVPGGAYYLDSDGTMRQAPQGGAQIAPAATPAAPASSAPGASAAPAADAASSGGAPAAPTPAPGAADWQNDPVAPPQKPDQMLGFVREATRPWDNLSQWAESGLRALPGGAAVDNAVEGAWSKMGLPTDAQTNALHQQMVTDAAARGYYPGKIGGFLGNVIGTAPALMVPGGALAQGAVAGAVSTDNPNSLASVSEGAALGGVLGKGGEVIGNGLTNTVAPRLSDNVRMLLDRKVPLTTGMMADNRGLLGRLEQFGQNIPVAGELIRKRGNEALTGFNEAVANEALAPINATVVPGNSGHEMYQSAKTAMGGAYDAVGSGADVPLDGPYAATMQAVRATAAKLPVDLRNRFMDVINREIGNRVDPAIGGLTADGITDAKAALNKEIAKVKNPSLFEGDYVDSLKATRNALTSMLGRTSPEAEAQLAAADRAYPGFKAYQRAVKNSTQNMTTPNGYFTPQQLQSAINSEATDDARAGGVTPLSDLAAAGKEILPRRFRDVVSPMQSFIEGGVGAGVIGSDVLGGPHTGLALAAPAAVTSLLYTKPVQDSLRAALLRSAAARKALEAATGPLEKYIRPTAGLVGGISASPVLNALTPQGAVAQ